MVLWVRSSTLPTEYYSREIITLIARQLGKLLRVDGLTVAGTRANFARLCIQFHLKKPLPKWIWAGEWKQILQDEGVTTLCFLCGIMGHRKESRPEMMGEGTGDTSNGDLNHSVSGEENRSNQGTKLPIAGEETTNYGPWILVGDGRRRPASPEFRGVGKKIQRQPAEWDITEPTCLLQKAPTNSKAE